MGRKNGGKRKATGSVGGVNPKAGKQRSGGGKRGARSGGGHPDTVVTDDVEHAVDDIYEADDVTADEEVHRDRYDDLDEEYELPAGFEDEEIDEDEAFNSEDERLYGHLFEGNAGGKYSDFDSEEDELAEDGAGGHDDDKDVEGGLAYNALLSDEEGGGGGVDSEDEEEEDDDGEAAWPREDGREARGGRNEAGGSSEDGEDAGGAAGDVGNLDGGDGRGGSDDDVGLEGGEGWQDVRRVEMIRELYPENMYAVGSGAGKVTVEELIAATGVSSGQSGDLKAVQKLSKKLKPLEAPLPGPIQARAERRAAYDQSKKDIKKWMPLVKSQREAPTLQLTSGGTESHKIKSLSALASNHTPENKMELEVAAMLEAAGAHTASAVAESEEALAMRMMDAAEAKARKEELAKQRALLFYHEVKAKRLKKIKSKDYRRRLKKAEKKRQEGAGEDGMLMLGKEELQQQQEEAEYERAKERLTLKHKNTSQFIRRAIKRGAKHPDEGTREAIAEQLRIGQEIRRRVHAFRDKDNSGSSDGSDGDSSDDERRDERISRKLASAARDVLEGDGPELGTEKGLMSLPFMKRSMEKQKQRAKEQARDVLNGAMGVRGGRGGDREVRRGILKFGSDTNGNPDSDMEDEVFDAHDDDDDVDEDAEAKIRRLTAHGSGKSQPSAETAPSDFRSFIPSKKFQGMKEGFVFTKGSNGLGYYAEQPGATGDSADTKVPGRETKAPKIPKKQTKRSSSKKAETQQMFSQEDLIRKAFAGDDVVDEFKKSKAEEVEAELPHEEVPGELPGWGTWSNPNKKEPAWVRDAKAKAESKKAAAARARKDVSMEFVVISEKWDARNASKYKTQTVPFPFNSKETYERSMRQPLGKDFNTVDSFRNLTRPAVVKDSGVIIEPLQFSKSVGLHNAGAKMSKRPGIIKVAGGNAKRSSLGR